MRMPLPSAISLSLALLLATGGTATRLSAADASAFDRYTQGRTIHFDWRGTPYGAERYLPGQRVIWSFLDGECVTGEWYARDSAAGPEICFLYEGRDTPQCWTYEITARGLSVSTGGEGSALTLTEREDPQEEMLCLGPEVGV